MIVVDLLCASAHRFEGWFPSAEALEAQLAQGAVRCPLCGSAEVRRLPSAPYVHTGERGADTPEGETSPLFYAGGKLQLGAVLLT